MHPAELGLVALVFVLALDMLGDLFQGLVTGRARHK